MTRRQSKLAIGNMGHPSDERMLLGRVGRALVDRFAGVDYPPLVDHRCGDLQSLAGCNKFFFRSVPL